MPAKKGKSAAGRQGRTNGWAGDDILNRNLQEAAASNGFDARALTKHVFDILDEADDDSRSSSGSEPEVVDAPIGGDKDSRSSSGSGSDTDNEDMISEDKSRSSSPVPDDTSASGSSKKASPKKLRGKKPTDYKETESGTPSPVKEPAKKETKSASKPRVRVVAKSVSKPKGRPAAKAQPAPVATARSTRGTTPARNVRESSPPPQNSRSARGTTPARTTRGTTPAPEPTSILKKPSATDRKRVRTMSTDSESDYVSPKPSGTKSKQAKDAKAVKTPTTKISSPPQVSNGRASASNRSTTSVLSPARAGPGRICHLTRIAAFSSAHRLYSDKLSPQENIALFGKCANANGHGHNYRLEVTVQGKPDPVSGMVMNLVSLDDLIRFHVVETLDHRNIDKDVDYFKLMGFTSTAENLAIYIWDKLATALPAGVAMERVRLHETDKNYVEFYGGK